MAAPYSEDEIAAFERQAELESQNYMAQIERDQARMRAAQEQVDRANARAAGLAARSNDYYDPNRPSTWNAPDSPKRTTLDVAQEITPDYSAVEEARALQQAGVASLEARRDAAAPSLDGGPSDSERLASARISGGRSQANDAFNRSGERIVTSRANPAAPSTKKMVGAMLGGQARPVLDPFGNPVPEMETVDEVIVGSDGRPMLDPMNPSGPPLTRRVARPTGRVQMERAPGLIAEGRQAALGESQQQIETARVSTQLLQQEADTQAQITAQMRARELARQQRIEAQRQATDDAYRAVQLANAELQDSAEIDPDKGWADKGTGAKIAAVIAAGLLGFAGMDPFAHIRAVTEDSLAAQKANQDRMRARVGSAQGVQTASENLLGQLRTQLGDEQLADEAYRLTMLQDVKAQAMAKLADAQVAEMTAAQATFMNGLDQQIAEAQRRLELTAATTPDRIVSSRSPYTPEQRAMLKAEHAAGLKAVESGSSAIIEGTAKREQIDAESEGAIRKEQAKHQFGDEISEGDAKLLLAHSDNVKYAKAVIDQVDRIFVDFGDGDLPGRGVSSATDRLFRPNETSRFNSMVKDSTDTFGRLVSGAAIKDDEMERFLESVRAGVGDEALSQNLRDMQQKAIDILQNSERALPDRLRAHFRRVDQEALPGLQSDLTGASGRTNRPGGVGGVVRVHE